MSSAPNVLRNLHPDLFFENALPVLRELFNYEIEQSSLIRDKIFDVQAHDREIWQYSELHDLPQFQEVGEGEELPKGRSKEGSNKTLTIKKYGMSFVISREMIEDGKLPIVETMIRNLAKSARETQEVSAMNIFNNGFDSETSADGQFVFDTDHSLPSGGTFRNELSTAADLNATSLKTAITDFRTQFVGDSGIHYGYTPRTLLVPEELRQTALELVGSDKLPDTADNNMNSIRDAGLVVMASPRLTDSNAWFLTSDPSDTGLRIIERQPISTRSWMVEEKDSMQYAAQYREEIGVMHAKGIFGSPGSS